MKRSIIGIPIGDPSGIGPEIVLKALQNNKVYDICKPLVIGNEAVLKRIGYAIGAPLTFNLITEPGEGTYRFGAVDLISLDNLDAATLKYGVVQSEAGRAAFEYIVKTVTLANEGKIQAIATTPINKEAIKAAHIDFIGHTEMLADLTGTPDPLTMFQDFCFLSNFI